jgi:hypothetical protein
MKSLVLKSLVLAGALLLSLLTLCSPARCDDARTLRLPGLKNSLNSKPARVAAIAADVKPAALWDGRNEVEFHASDYPKMAKAAEARFLINEEYVLGITVNGESRAYPTRFVSWHHIINDRVGKSDKGGPVFVTVTYCIVCNSGLRFDTPLVGDKPLRFDFYGLYNGVMTMFDKQTKTVWLQVEGRAVKGPLLGATLKSGPLLDTTWGQWKKLHPDTLVMAPDTHFTDCYEPKGAVMARGYTNFPAAYFSKTITRRDARLPMFESVLAVSLPVPQEAADPVGEAQTSPNPDALPVRRALHRAYPLQAFKGKTGAINEVVAGTPVTVFFLADTETMTALSPVLDGRTLTFETRRRPATKPEFYDKETGTRWNVEGKAEEGPLAGRQLARIESHMSQWYGWASYFPQTTIYGQNNDLPQISLNTQH